jgi:predicted dithiol-disulfide oxidoreductase (DUF899 family)
MNHNPIVSRKEWLTARKLFLTREKEFTRAYDKLRRQRRELPWVKIDKSYELDGPSGKLTLAQLFDGRSQLLVKHFMMGPGVTHQCVGCSFAMDHIQGLLVHLENHDVTYVAVARAPIEEIEVVRKRMGWHVTWVSSYNSDFNYDFNVSFKPEELATGRAHYNYHQGNPGLEDLSGHSVFYKDDAGQIFHTYSTYARGEEQFLAAYGYLDVTPKGRNEHGPYYTLGDLGASKKHVRQRRNGRSEWPIPRALLRLHRPCVSDGNP